MQILERSTSSKENWRRQRNVLKRLLKKTRQMLPPIFILRGFTRKKGYIYLKLEKFSQASLYLEKAVGINPDDLFARYYLGYCYARLKRVDDAISQYEFILTKREKFEDVYFCLGNLYYEKKDLEKACYFYLKELKANPENPHALFNLATIYFEKGNLDKAESTLKKFLEIPNDYSAHTLMGDIYMKKGIYDKAIEEYEKAKSLKDEQFQGEVSS